MQKKHLTQPNNHDKILSDLGIIGDILKFIDKGHLQ